jgi:hypothetical protein
MALKIDKGATRSSISTAYDLRNLFNQKRKGIAESASAERRRIYSHADSYVGI